ncbi:MAG: UDP-2,3-diacylglucosamine diphosphatase LpxI, partial [Planctomycetes bacterium]|nr:UDP-2,3-diacylglucosamine diphosphatase LpxI [Planctomycetota bacterium]
MAHGSAERRIGLLAAWGRFPVLVAEALRRQDYHVSCIGVADHADPELRAICHEFQWVGWGSLGGAIKFFRRCGVREATMAGKFHKVLMYQPGLWWRHLPDWTFIKTFYHYLITHRHDNKDDTLLGALTDAFAAEGIVFHPATDFAPELLAQAGNIAGRPPSATQEKDIEFGWDIAKQLGRLDIGQSVCVKDRAVVAVEAIEGTDACILRAGELCKKGGFTIVKVA